MYGGINDFLKTALYLLKLSFASTTGLTSYNFNEQTLIKFMHMTLGTVLAFLLYGITHIIHAQHVGSSPEYIKTLTSQWKGERFADGRPKVPDIIIERLQNNTLEQVWGYLERKGFRNQIEKDWIILKPGETMTGRVVTAQFMPTRPDLDSLVRAQGKVEGRSQKGGINIWPIDILTKGDIYVADGFGKVRMEL